LIITSILLIITSYLLGSIPFGLIIGKLTRGIDVRQFGSGNIGFTNCYRTLGPLPGLLVLAGDVAKGAICIFLARFLGGQDLIAILAGSAAIAGHNWSIYLKFTGGKGVATTAGVVISLVPKISLILLAIWLVILLVTKFVSLASMTIALAFPFLILYFYPERSAYIFFSFLVAVVVIFQHRSNIKRLLKGNELRITEQVRTERK